MAQRLFPFPMPRIALLHDTLASQVAAGEVVERPASIVRELIENSLDAQANHIHIALLKGGLLSIEVSDDGEGMDREDALLCLQRHATSKLSDSQGLSNITTLGFRGEAIPSIASVSRFRLSTRQPHALSGTELYVEGGTLRFVKEVGMSQGTSIIAQDLFFNVPARRKFLKTPSTEYAHIERQVRLHALAFPEKRFTLYRDKKPIFDLPATTDWRTRIGHLHTQDITDFLLPIPPFCAEDFSFEGFMLPAQWARKTPRQIHLFLNGRPIEDLGIFQAIRSSFGQRIPKELWPQTWLRLRVAPHLVDVNVHPAKREVRLSEPSPLYEAITKHLATLLAHTTSPRNLISKEQGEEKPLQGNAPSQTPEPPTQSSPPPLAKELWKNLQQEIQSKNSLLTHAFKPLDTQEELALKQEDKNTQSPPNHTHTKLRVLSLLCERFVLLEEENGLVVLDPLAARKRITYEKLLASHEGDEVPTQSLLLPEVFELDALEYDLVTKHAPFFKQAGLYWEPFGNNTISLHSIPAWIHFSDLRSFFLSLLGELEGRSSPKKARLLSFDDFAKRLSSQVGKREPCCLEGAQRLLEDLFLTRLPYATPEGKPTLYPISLKNLYAKFGHAS